MIYILIGILEEIKKHNGTPSPTRTDMNRSSTDFESSFHIKPTLTLAFNIASVTVSPKSVTLVSLKYKCGLHNIADAIF